jgi:hypothetical protein
VPSEPLSDNGALPCGIVGKPAGSDGLARVPAYGAQPDEYLVHGLQPGSLPCMSPSANIQSRANRHQTEHPPRTLSLQWEAHPSCRPQRKTYFRRSLVPPHSASGASPKTPVSPFRDAIPLRPPAGGGSGAVAIAQASVVCGQTPRAAGPWDRRMAIVVLGGWIRRTRAEVVSGGWS